MRWAMFLLVLMILLPIGGFSLGGYLWFHHWKTDGQITTAIIEHARPVEEHRRNRSYWSCVISYSFVTMDGTDIRGEGSSPFDNDGCQTKVGKTISVRYMREHPEKNILTSTLAFLKQRGVFLTISTTGFVSFLIIYILCALFLLSRKEKRLLTWGTPVAGTICKSCNFRRRGVPYLKIWCRYSSRNGRIRTLRRTFSLLDQTDQGAGILRKWQDNTTVLYDPAHPWLAALYPLEIFRIRETSRLNPPSALATRNIPIR
ncbi:MAG: DUF3592 domain-containing protein [Acetobacter sp.]|uniref:DUF3592 domain-containing protein n=1 Tax=Acetobacter sp. TaxID=440 RepID=UPI0039E77091